MRISKRERKARTKGFTHHAKICGVPCFIKTATDKDGCMFYRVMGKRAIYSVLLAIICIFANENNLEWGRAL